MPNDERWKAFTGGGARQRASAVHHRGTKNSFPQAGVNNRVFPTAGDGDQAFPRAGVLECFKREFWAMVSFKRAVYSRRFFCYSVFEAGYPGATVFGGTK